MFSMCGPGDRGRGPWTSSPTNGLGRKVFANGDEYLGMWAQGKPEGRGQYKWNGAPQRHEYFGEWKAGEAHGNGKLETFSVVPPHGVEKTYEGQWVNGKADGVGIGVEASGSEYRGAWKDDHRDGPGIETTLDDEGNVTCVYAGQFVRGERHGHGVILWTGPQGKAEGVETTYGMQHVFVTERYKGQFEGGKMSGDGHCFWQGGREYRGQWRENMMHGFGVHTWFGDSAFAEGKATLVKGSWTTAMASWTSASWAKTYTGYYAADAKHGHGVLDHGDGRRYEGEFRKGEMHGTGRYTNKFLTGGKAEDEEVWWEGEWCQGRHLRWTDGNSDSVVHDLNRQEQYMVDL